MKENKEVMEYCNTCKHQGTDICKVCVYRVMPSGKTSVPSFWEYLSLNRSVKTDAPPLGVKPRYAHEEDRMRNLAEAMVRYLNALLILPTEWVDEYNELMKKLQRKKAK